MILSALIRKRQPGSAANANPAKAANDTDVDGEPFARLATLALATHVNQAEVNVSMRAKAIHITDQETISATLSPSIGDAEALVAKARINAPIKSATAAGVVELALQITGIHQNDAGTEQIVALDAVLDDRRSCDQCSNLRVRRCLAANGGVFVASPNYEPVRDIFRRCEGYVPRADDADRRLGRERWPQLT